MKFQVPFIVLFALASLGSSQDPFPLKRLYLKLDSKALYEKYASRFELQPVDFGLTPNQIEQITNLTQGQVSFANFFAIEDLTPDEAQEISQTPEFAGISQKNIPPPLIENPADPELANQWWMKDIKVPQAWQSASGKGVTIADCDAGFYAHETDLEANMLLEHRYDLSDKEKPFEIEDGYYTTHGTAVSAIMAAVLDGQGTSGIAYSSKIVPLQNFNYDPRKDDLDKEEATARCVLRALTIQDVDIIVLENQTGTGSSETIAGTRAAVRLAQLAGITVVSAAGNFSKELTAELQDDTGSVIVGALDPYARMASFSNYGSRITVAAFGDRLWTLKGPNKQMGYFGGTSGATPQVAATVALMLEVNPKLTPKQVREVLTQTRVTKPENTKVGGLLDAATAVNAAKQVRPDEDQVAELEHFKKELQKIISPGI